MDKTIDIALNKFSPIPTSLCEASSKTPKSQIPINLAGLYHHYYLDCYGQVPPNPDPAQFEYLRFLTNTRDFRLAGDGIGASTAARRHRSNELGQAFCRYFLHDHLGVTYFAHIEHILNKGFQSKFCNLRIDRISEGDVPDYLCSRNARRAYVAEAKGRYSSISFNSSEFKSWRNQFSRVIAKDRSDNSVSLKGFIVGTRFATEQNRQYVKSRISAEDPRTPGSINDDVNGNLGAMVASIHYGNIATKLRQPILAASLTEGFLVPDEIRFPAVVWEFQASPVQGVSYPLQGRRFVGGYFPSTEGTIALEQQSGRLIFRPVAPLRLDVGTGTFFGVEESIFRIMASVARRGLASIAEIDTFPDIQPFYSAISVLRDGSIMSPIEFLTPVAQEVF
jgi:hypothetical protein